MTPYFEPVDGQRVTVDLRHVRWWLQLYVCDLLDLLGPTPVVPDDPLDALAESAATDPERPGDPVLARLIPDGVVDDEAAAMEFRRFTHQSLTAQKRADATALMSLLSGSEHVIERAQALRLLAALNDLRLMLGTRLMVADDNQFGGDDLGDLSAYSSYLHLGWLQEGLLEALRGPTP